MSKRYYLASPPIDQRALLDGPEAHHLLHVMRAEVGTELTLFDGNGGEYPACVTECKRREVQLEVGPRQEVDRDDPRSLTELSPSRVDRLPAAL